jgi:hypothetical protein
VPTSQLIISFQPKDPARLRQQFPPGKPTYFLYLGVDYFQRKRLERQLGPNFIQIDITELHDKVAREIRSEHIKWIDQLNRKYGSEIEWWFKPIASRNIYVSNLFQYSCYMEILERLWNHSELRPELIFVESMGLASAIYQWAVKNGLVAQVVSKSEKYYLLSGYGVSLLRFVYFLGILLMRQIAAYTSRKIFGGKHCPVGKLAIVDTFVHDYSLDERGLFHDIYFPYLYDYLEKNGFQILVHPVLYGFSFNYFSIYKRMRQSGTHFIIPEDYLHLADFIQILTYPLRTWRQKIKADPFRNFDLADIIKEEQVRGMTDNASLLAGLIHRVFIRLGRSGVRPEIIISWYENQVNDKALVAAARQAFPQAKIIGAQIFIYSYNLLYLFPIQSEVEAGMAPHLLLGMSEHLCKFAQTFTKDIPCYPAASLRYAYIFKHQRKVMAFPKGSTILVLLPHDIQESAEMLEIISLGLDRIQKHDRLLIKCHPHYAPEQLQHAFGDDNWPEKFEFFQGTLVDAFKEAAVVISSNSSAMVEAAAMGIPVIFLGRQTALNQNILEDVKSNLMIECFTTNEMVAKVNQLLNITSEESEQYKDLGEEIIRLFFLPITSEAMLPFLGECSINKNHSSGF